MDFIANTLQNISPLFIYILVGGFLLLESTGIPVINATILLFAGALSSQGHINLILLMLIAVTASMLGATSAYVLGKRFGEAFLRRLARWLHIDERKIQLASHWLQRSGIRMIFLSRILPYIRPFACFPAGIFGMPFQRFFLAGLAGSLLWCLPLLLIGWTLGPRWELAVSFIQTYTWPFIGGVLLLFVISIFAKRAFNNYLQRHLSEV